MKVYKGSSNVAALMLLTLALDRGKWLSSCDLAALPPQKTPGLMIRRLGGLQIQSEYAGEEKNNLPLLGFKFWIFQSAYCISVILPSEL
jgi:hypothetical protein